MAKYCANCGAKVEDDQDVCLKCGKVINKKDIGNASKSKIVAGVLGILLGSFGVHNFYLGYYSKGIVQLLLTLLLWFPFTIGPAIAGVWGLIEGILILIGEINKDGFGNPLRD